VTPAALLAFLDEFYRELLEIFNARLAYAREVVG
jgi:hypothetical protein